MRFNTMTPVGSRARFTALTSLFSLAVLLPEGHVHAATESAAQAAPVAQDIPVSAAPRAAEAAASPGERRDSETPSLPAANPTDAAAPPSSPSAPDAAAEPPLAPGPAPREGGPPTQPSGPQVQEPPSDQPHPPQTPPPQEPPSFAATASDTPQPIPGTAESVRAEAATRNRWLSYLGLALDLGVSGILPDGGLLLTGRPARWAHIQLGMGFNGSGFAIRGGATLVSPFVVPLSLTWEAGHYFEGDANRIVHWFSGDAQDVVSLKRFSYDYMNLLAGLQVGTRRFAFYVRVGVTWMGTTVKDFQQSVRDVAHIDLIASDPQIHYQGPALKLGTVAFFR